MEKKTWLPPTAGILDIISGSFGLFAGIILLVLGTLGSGLLRLFEVGIPEISPAVILALLSAIAIPLIIAGILAISRRHLRAAEENVGFSPGWLHRCILSLVTSGDGGYHFHSPIQERV